MNPEAKKILQDTYDVLEARGWCQGEMRSADGRVCLEGAISDACVRNGRISGGLTRWDIG